MTSATRRRLARLEAAQRPAAYGPTVIMFAGVYRGDAGELASEVAFAWVLGRRGSISREPGEDEATFVARVEHRANALAAHADLQCLSRFGGIGSFHRGHDLGHGNGEVSDGARSKCARKWRQRLVQCVEKCHPSAAEAGAHDPLRRQLKAHEHQTAEQPHAKQINDCEHWAEDDR